MGFDKKIGGVTIHFFGEDSAEPPELYLEEHPRTTIEKGGALTLLKAKKEHAAYTKQVKGKAVAVAASPGWHAMSAGAGSKKLDAAHRAAHTKAQAFHEAEMKKLRNWSFDHPDTPAPANRGALLALHGNAADSHEMAAKCTAKDNWKQLSEGARADSAETHAEHTKTFVKSVLKAIGTKPSEEREKPVKQAPKNPTATVGASANGNKTYSYGNKVNPPGEKAAPTQSTPSGESPEKPMSASPERLATLLGISTSTLQKLATGKTEQQFVHHFRAKGSTFMAKYRVPDDYLHEVYAALHKMNPMAKGGTVRVAREHLREDITEAEENIKQLKHGIKRDKAALKQKKSANPAVPPRELKARGVTLAKDVPGLLTRSFAVNPAKLKKGSEEQRLAEVMVVSGANSLPKLATLLHKGYDLSKSQADEMAVELFNTLKSEGALT